MNNEMMPQSAPEIRTPRVELMTITPEMAEKWLGECNRHNRKMNVNAIDRIARDIKAGHFHLSHQGIAFSVEGVLLDGQNRLAAIMRAGVSVTMYVWFDLLMSAQAVTDQHTPRLSSDVLTLSDRFGAVGKRKVAVLRSLAIGMGTRRKLTVAEEAELLALHREAIEFSLLYTSGKTRGVFTCVTVGVIARAWYTVDREKLKHFCDVLRDPGAIGPNESAAATLWAFLVESPFRRGVPQRERYGKVERALAAFLKGERIEKLYPTKAELFPLPEEIADVKTPESQVGV